MSSFGNSSFGSLPFSSDTSKTETPALNASDFFSGAFNKESKSVLTESNNNFTNIEIPDFLKR